MDARVTDLLAEVGLPASAAAQTRLTGADPVLASPLPVAEGAAASLAAVASAAGLLWEERTGASQDVEVDVARAGASLLSFLLQAVTDRDSAAWAAATNPLIGLQRCRDGRWVHLHGSYEHLKARTEAVLGLPPDPDPSAISAAADRWDAQALEDALAEAGTCGAMVRTAAEWAVHPQGQEVGALPRVTIERIGDAPPEPVGDGIRPLGGLRCLDLTRMLAGPTHGRLLAEHGADVLLVSSDRLPNLELFVMDTSHGKRSAALHLDEPADLARLRKLAQGADVFAQGYRGGALEHRGLGPQELAELRPGIVYVTIGCYGDTGPWRERRGWEQLAQSVSGMAVAHGSEDAPALVPAAACDYTTGHLAALGTLAALRQRASEGGSWHVRASLCQTAGWFERMPRVDPAAATGFGDPDRWSVTSDTPWGRLRHLTPVAQLSATPARWDLPSTPVGTHRPAWRDG